MNLIKNAASNAEKILGSSRKHCPHTVTNKFWVQEKTLLVKRDGYGNARKTVLERCQKCGEQRKHEVHFSDMRVIVKK